MQRSLLRFRPAQSLLVLTTFAIFAACGGNSSTSFANEGTPSADQQSLFLLGALKIDSADCVAQADATAAMLPGGIFDLAFSSSYSAQLLLKNRLARAGFANETEGVSLRSAEITLTTRDSSVLKKYSTVGVGFIDGATASAAYGIMSVTLIPAELALTEPVQSAQNLIAKIRVLGEAFNGMMLTSSELYLPIRVCTGCLVEYPVDAADPTPSPGSGYLCTTSASEPAAAPAPCVLGQDLPFSCVHCAASHALCRDPSLNPSISH